MKILSANSTLQEHLKHFIQHVPFIQALPFMPDCFLANNHTALNPLECNLYIVSCPRMLWNTDWSSQGIELRVHRKVALPVNSISWLIPDLVLMLAFLCVVLFSVQVIIAGSIAVAAKNLHLPTVSVRTSMHIQHNSLTTATTEYGKIFTIAVNANVEVPCHRNRTALSLTFSKNH